VTILWLLSSLALANPSTPAGSHWAFLPVVRPQPPAVNDEAWIRTPMDRFVLKHLEERGIRPSRVADRRTLIRRLSLDLRGLPPTPQEVACFVGDPRPDAYERLVDVLLASARFGERWGRHWLDIARYADSDGYENDRRRPNAWKYRDWVIGAFNRDLPFDRFTIEQLAGDLLPEPTIEQRVAAGLHRNTLAHTSANADKEKFRTIAVKDRVNTTGTIWLGLTLHCAECHSHKYDPVSQREYYQLYAFFNNVEEEDLEIAGEKIRTLRAAPSESFVHDGGDFRKQGERTFPAMPAFLPPLVEGGDALDRLDLAQWLLDPRHPLTARVTVNRFWQHLFGQGLVRTPENFGRRGDAPTHPWLLDWLASEFVELGWSRKEMIRRVVTSATYRQTSRERPELAKQDPDNLWLWRQNRFRVEGEIVRDLALAVGGLLNSRIGGPSIQPPLPVGLKSFDELKEERFMERRGTRFRRGLYINVQRTLAYPMLSVFDAPSGNEPCPLRQRSTTPMQALALTNDPALVECAQALGRRLFEERHIGGERVAAGRDPEARLRYGFELCLARPPLEEELRVLAALLADQRGHFEKNPDVTRRAIGERLPTGPDAAARAAWVEVAAALLNLAEFVTRE
jgi:hypothetical protein